MNRNQTTVIVAIICLMAFTLVALPNAWGAEKILETKITSSSHLIDKNGRPFIRFIVDEAKTVSGQTYTVGVPVMAFGVNVSAEAKALKAGDTLKAIVQLREYNSSAYYTILKWLK